MGRSCGSGSSSSSELESAAEDDMLPNVAEDAELVFDVVDSLRSEGPALNRAPCILGNLEGILNDSPGSPLPPLMLASCPKNAGPVLTSAR